MMIRRQGTTVLVIFNFILIFGLSGCRRSLVSGHYEGVYGEIQNEIWNEIPIEMEVSQKDPDHATLKITTHEGMKFPLTQLRFIGTKLELDAPWLARDTIELQSVPKKQISTRLNPEGVGEQVLCFSSEKPLFIEICNEKTQLSLRIFDQFHVLIKSISARFHHEIAPLTLELPLKLKLSEAIQLALSQNFDVKIRYQQWIQSHYEAKAAYLNLIPHLTTNLIWNAQPSFITFISTLQAWAPFILPTYWLQAANAKSLEEVKRLEVTSLRQGLISTTEELCYALIRDEAILKVQLDSYEEFLGLKQKLHANGIDPQVNRVLQDLIQSILDSLESDTADIKEVIRADRFAIASTLGLRNIEAIESVSIDHEKLPLERAAPLDPIALGNLATRRSLEIEQILLTKKIAERWIWENLFNWVDPFGDPKQGLGFNIPVQQKARRSRIQEINEQGNQIQTQLLNSTHRLVLKYNQALKTHGIILDQMKSDEFNFEELLALKKDDLLTFDIEENKKAALKRVGHKIAEQISLANFRIARAQLDRNLCQGYCSLLMPQMESPQTPFVMEARN